MEKDLFAPIKEYFENQGFVCDGEVEDIDLYMEKDGESIAVELKQTLDFKALQQAAIRQKITDMVYIGIFKPTDLFSRSFKDKIYLLNRLGIGLIVVSKRSKEVSIVCEPIVSELVSYKRRNKKKREKLSSEFSKRKTKSNTGGVHATKLITSYREDALLVLDAVLELGGEAKLSQVKELSKVDRASTILYKDYYGWFVKVGKGVYKVSEAGLKAAEEFEDTMYALKKNKNS